MYGTALTAAFQSGVERCISKRMSLGTRSPGNAESTAPLDSPNVVASRACRTGWHGRCLPMGGQCPLVSTWPARRVRMGDDVQSRRARTLSVAPILAGLHPM